MAEETRKDWLAILIVVFVAALALLPAMLYGSPSNRDLTHHFRLALHFYDSLHAGHLPHGWLAEAAGGYGDTTLRFYPPLTYYLLACARLLTSNWYNASLLTYTLLSITGGLGAYLWARESLPRNAAVCAAALYAFAPYHLNQLYQSFLLAEYAGSAILPFTFAFASRVCRRGQLRDVLGLAASFGLLILTHLPLTVIGALALLVYSLFCLDRKKFGATVLRLSAGVLLGLAASASYWVTMVAELRWFGGQQTSSDISTVYHTNFVFSTFSTDNPNVWWMNILTIATFGLLLPALAFRHARLETHSRRRVLGVALVLLFAFLMTTYASWPLWKISATLQSVQFPWRWLILVSLSGAVVSAAYLPHWVEKARGKTRPFALLVAGGMMISLAFVISHAVREADYLPREQFEAHLRSIPNQPSYDMWWPVWAKQSALQTKDKVQAEARTINLTSWEPLQRRFEIGAGSATEARIATFYYPLWQASANGKLLATRPAEDGAMLVSLPAEAATVELNFHEPSYVGVAQVVTMAGWLLIVLLFVSSHWSINSLRVRWNADSFLKHALINRRI
jgi:hypothetical protein